MPPGTAMINVTSDGHHFFHTKYSATKNKTTPIHSPEPNSVNARSTLTNVRVRCAWNHPATSWSGPVRGFAMARATQFWGKIRGVVKATKSSPDLILVKRQNSELRHRTELPGHHSDNVRFEGLRGQTLTGMSGWRHKLASVIYRLLQYQKFAAELTGLLDD